MNTAQETLDSLLKDKNNHSDLRKKEEELYIDKVNTRYDELLRKKELIEKSKNIDLSLDTQLKEAAQIQNESDEYLILARLAKCFINEDFNDCVTFFPKNLILIGAKSGDGKSTTSANIAIQILQQNGRMLIITNEEQRADVFNRVTCLLKNWSYTKHSQFTDEQLATFRYFTGLLANRMTVIQDDYNGGTGHTTTLEGIINILETLIKQGIKYDAIILDYYQNVSSSTEFPYLKDWEVQDRLVHYLDQYKNRYMAPLVVLAQLKQNEEEKTPFKERIEGRKSIYNKATCAVEMIAEREFLRTAWIFRKTRFSAAVGKVVYTGYDKGKFVKYTPEFSNEVMLKLQAKENAQLLSQKNKGK